jgi:hypothetical protein
VAGFRSAARSGGAVSQEELARVWGVPGAEFRADSTASNGHRARHWL